VRVRSDLSRHLRRLRFVFVDPPLLRLRVGRGDLIRLYPFSHTRVAFVLTSRPLVDRHWISSPACQPRRDALGRWASSLLATLLPARPEILDRSMAFLLALWASYRREGAPPVASVRDRTPPSWSLEPKCYRAAASPPPAPDDDMTRPLTRGSCHGSAIVGRQGRGRGTMAVAAALLDGRRRRPSGTPSTTP